MKILKLTPWLKLDEALKYLHKLTGEEVSSVKLLELCEMDHCRAFAYMNDIEVLRTDDNPGLEPEENGETELAEGWHLVFNPAEAFTSSHKNRTAYIRGHIYGEQKTMLNLKTFDLKQIQERGVIFHHKDIESLAAIMNAEPCPSPNLKNTQQSITHSSSTPADEKKPKYRYQEQDNLILEKIRSLGYNPKSMPRQQQGKAGVKKQARDRLKDESVFEAENSFPDAWKRLRKNGDIQDSD